MRRRSGRKHAVGLIEDEKLDVVQAEMPLLHQVEQPSGGGDEQMHAAIERLDLWMLADAAVDDGVPEREMAAVGADAVADLSGEFAGGCEHEGSRVPGLGKLVSWLAVLLEWRYVQRRQDLPVVETMTPKVPTEGCDKLVRADVGTARYLRLRRRLLRREPSRETHQRLLRTEIAAVIAVVALEASQLLRHG